MRRSLSKTATYIPLEQFDNESGDYGALDLIPKTYSQRIGYFIIVFSSLEHSINLVIANMEVT